jgi:O-antigen/teichoic acid export membrane protein
MISLIEYGTPLFRMIVLSHGLSLPELGFASILTATYSSFEQFTDFAISRFLFSVKREDHVAALAGAHGLSILRGIVVCLLALAAAPFIARAMGLADHVFDFLILAPAILIRSFEHLAPRVAEREYKYGAQFKAALAANLAAFIGLTITVVLYSSHIALIVSIYLQNTVYVIATHILAEESYVRSFFSKWFKQAIGFGLPLMVNGIGLALSFQGDRFIVGYLVDLSELGVYSVAILATTFPASLLSRFTGTVLLAALYNAHQDNPEQHSLRLRFAGHFLPLVNAAVQIGLLYFLNFACTTVFGKNFSFPDTTVWLLIIGAFFRLSRGEPFVGMLLHLGKTRQLAIGNFASISSLPFAFALGSIYHSIDAMLVGRLLGEIVGYAVTLWVSRASFAPALKDHAISMLISLGVMGLAIAAYTVPAVHDSLLVRAGVTVLFLLAIAIYGYFDIIPKLVLAFPSAAQRLPARFRPT